MTGVTSHGRRTSPSAQRDSFEPCTQRYALPNPARGPAAGDDSAVRPGVLQGQERERERERCVSAADASTYGRTRVRNDPLHICPQRTHAKTTPHHLDTDPSPKGPCKTLAIDPPENRPKPDLFPSAPYEST
jgi:hypothetical protein